jgi:predicted nucleic acid-binding protein
MNILLDTNILVRLANPNDPDYAMVVRVVGTLRSQGDELDITPQNLTEFRAVATRPVANNGLGYTGAEATSLVARFESDFTLLPDISSIHPIWKDIVHRCNVLGKRVHDARLLAVAVAHAADGVLTFNVSHFIGMVGVTPVQLLDPRTV